MNKALFAYKNAEKMISILACRPWAAEDIEELKELEAAATVTEGTRTLEEQLKFHQVTRARQQRRFWNSA